MLMPLWLPLLGLAMMSAGLAQGRPVFYRARRLGGGGGVFQMLKIRTMVRDADRRGPPVSGSEDPRITRVGRVLRRTKLDELPQFLHVLSGRMSVVGRRPESPAYREYYPADGELLAARPGLTGYGALYFFLCAESGADAADFEAYYVRDVLPHTLQLDQQCHAELSAAPFRTTVAMLGWTLCAVVHRTLAVPLPLRLARLLTAAAPTC